MPQLTDGSIDYPGLSQEEKEIYRINEVAMNEKYGPGIRAYYEEKKRLLGMDDDKYGFLKYGERVILEIAGRVQFWGPEAYSGWEETQNALVFLVQSKDGRTLFLHAKCSGPNKNCFRYRLEKLAMTRSESSLEFRKGSKIKLSFRLKDFEDEAKELYRITYNYKKKFRETGKKMIFQYKQWRQHKNNLKPLLKRATSQDYDQL